MKKTTQEFRRESVKKIINNVLGENKTTLDPVSINTFESLNDDFTTVDLVFAEKLLEGTKSVTINNIKAKGFVDGLFLGLHINYAEDYPSLDKIKLIDIMVNPIMRASTVRGSDAKTSVIFRVEVENHGVSEFQHKSRSLIYSSFVAALEAFQFYINCEKAFYKIKFAANDAKERNRGDIVQSCLADLSKLTEVNTYAKTKI